MKARGKDMSGCNCANNVKFSIIVPVYNVERYLNKCLDSIVNQTYQNFEAILVDDGSTDSSGRVCDEYGEKYDFIKVVHQENGGLSAARNTGLNKAQGDWIIFVDSDDWVETDMLCAIDKHMQENEADVYTFNVNKVDEDGALIDKILYRVENETVTFRSETDKFDYYFNCLMQYSIGWEAWNSVFKREIIEANGFRFTSEREIFAEDYLFTFQYFLYVNKISVMCNIFYNYLQRGDSLLHKTDKGAVLLKLNSLAEYGYKSVCKSGLKYFKKHYYKLYFMLMNFHINGFFGGIPEDVVKASLKAAEKKGSHKKWMRKIRLHFMDLKQYMGEYRWIYGKLMNKVRVFVK